MGINVVLLGGDVEVFSPQPHFNLIEFVRLQGTVNELLQTVLENQKGLYSSEHHLLAV